MVVGLFRCCFLVFLFVLSENTFAANTCFEVFAPDQISRKKPFHKIYTIVKKRSDPSVAVRSPIDMADIITDTAQGDINYTGYSLPIIKKLRWTLLAYIEAENISLAAEVPFINEQKRRAGEIPDKATILSQLKDKTQLFLANIGLSKQPDKAAMLKDLNDHQLENLKKVTGRRAKDHYIKRTRDKGFFLGLEFLPDLSKWSEMTEASFERSFDLNNRLGQLDSRTVYWAHTTFLREKVLREEIETLRRSGDLLWVTERQFRDQEILLAAAYPPLIYILDYLSELGFPAFFQFKNYDLPFNSHFKHILMDKRLLAQFYLQKNINEDIRNINEENDFFGIKVTVKDSGVSVNQLQTFVQEAWQRFSQENGIPLHHLVFKVTDGTAYIETLNHNKAYVRALTKFYLSITKEYWP